MVRPPLLPQRTSFRPFWEKITSPLTVQAAVPTVVPSPPQVRVLVSNLAFESLTLEGERPDVAGYHVGVSGSILGGVASVRVDSVLGIDDGVLVVHMRHHVGVPEGLGCREGRGSQRQEQQHVLSLEGGLVDCPM